MRRRPHRRDRRVTARNTPGGIVTDFVHLAFAGNTSPTIIVLDLAELQPQAGGTGWASVTGYGDRNIPVTNMTFRQGAADFDVISAQLFANGQIDVTIAGGRDNAGWLIVEPFIPELQSPDGKACAGGLIWVPSPI